MWYAVWVKTGEEAKVMHMCGKWFGNPNGDSGALDAGDDVAGDNDTENTDDVDDTEESPYRVRGNPAIFEECFIPMKEIGWRTGAGWTVKPQILFPGYLFFSTDYPLVLHGKLKELPEYARLLGGSEGPIALKQREVDFLSRYMDKDKVVRMSTGELIGKELIVTSGPMLNHQGKVTYIDRRNRYCMLEMEFMGRLMTFKLGLDVVRKVE